MASQQFERFRADLTRKLHEPNAFSNVFTMIEQKTSVDRFYVVCAFASLLALYLIFGHFAELLCNLLGFAYPAYVSIRAIESMTREDDTQWLTYWVVFAFLNILEFGSETVVSYFPLYWLMKCAFLIYLYAPSTMGAQKIYHRFIRVLVAQQDEAYNRRLGKFADKAAETLQDGADLLKRQ